MEMIKCKRHYFGLSRKAIMPTVYFRLLMLNPCTKRERTWLTLISRESHGNSHEDYRITPELRERSGRRDRRGGNDPDVRSGTSVKYFIYGIRFSRGYLR